MGEDKKEKQYKTRTIFYALQILKNQTKIDSIMSEFKKKSENAQWRHLSPNKITINN